MVIEVKLQQVEDGVFLPLPDEALTQLDAKVGDSVLVISLESGVIRVSKITPEFRRQMEVADNLLKRYENTMRALREAGD